MPKGYEQKLLGGAFKRTVFALPSVSFPAWDADRMARAGAAILDQEAMRKEVTC